MTAEAPETIKLTRHSTATPVVKTKALISGTLPSRDLAASKAFYEQALGLEVRQMSEDRLVVRLGGDHVYEVVQLDEKLEMPILRHNGVNSRGDIVAEHARLEADKEKWGIKKLTKPMMQHGTFGYYLQDLDGNWWEGQPATEGPLEMGFEDLTDHADLTPEEARKWFRPDADTLGARVDAFREAHKDDNAPEKPSVMQATRISHGTLEVNSLQESRRFYEEVLGLFVFQHSPLSMLVGLGTEHRYVAVAAPQNNPNMEHALRNRLLIETEADLLDARKALGPLEGTTISELSEPAWDSYGRLTFEFRDLDRNWWELYYDPQGAPSHYFA